eukprot:123258-Hanusia_phi.AAC.1
MQLAHKVVVVGAAESQLEVVDGEEVVRRGGGGSLDVISTGYPHDDVRWMNTSAKDAPWIDGHQYVLFNVNA